MKLAAGDNYIDIAQWMSVQRRMTAPSDGTYRLKSVCPSAGTVQVYSAPNVYTTRRAFRHAESEWKKWREIQNLPHSGWTQFRPVLEAAQVVSTTDASPAVLANIRPGHGVGQEGLENVGLDWTTSTMLQQDAEDGNPTDGEKILFSHLCGQHDKTGTQWSMGIIEEYSQFQRSRPTPTEAPDFGDQMLPHLTTLPDESDPTVGQVEENDEPPYSQFGFAGEHGPLWIGSAVGGTNHCRELDATIPCGLLKLTATDACDITLDVGGFKRWA